MKTRLWLLSGLGACHLGMVSMGAAQADISSWGPIGIPLAYYSILTGANTGYSFFSPAIGPQFRAYFQVEDRDGKAFTDTLEKGKPQEVTTKIESLVLLMGEAEDRPQLRRSVAASLSRKMFVKYPDATKVTVFFDVFDPPPLERYVEGERPAWENLYKATFVNKKSTAMRESHAG